MKVFDAIKSKDIDELAEWFDQYVITDDCPWIQWWDKNYCSKCEPELSDLNDLDTQYAWCELHDNCRYFKDMDNILDNRQTIKMWLESEVED